MEEKRDEVFCWGRGHHFVPVNSILSTVFVALVVLGEFSSGDIGRKL